MKRHQIYKHLETLYGSPDLNDNQFSQIEHLIERLIDFLIEKPDTINENNLSIISSLAHQWLVCYDQSGTPDFTEFFKKIRKELAKGINFNIASSSLLAALYYLNDIIASSTALGRGCEESIIPNDQHNQVIYQLLEDMHSKNFIVNHLINQSRFVPKARKYETVLPLIFDIVETSYARLKGWKVVNLEIKQKNVDIFYQNQAESCMAKGTLSILRSLKNLPIEFSDVLTKTKLDGDITKQLSQCSIDSIETIKLETTQRRYRGGNSATIWLNLREEVQIESFTSIKLSEKQNFSDSFFGGSFRKTGEFQSNPQITIDDGSYHI